MNIIEQLANSDDEIKKNMSSEIAQWSKLKHIKPDLEFMLGNVICELQFKTTKNKIENIYCTSNIPLIKAINSTNKEDVSKHLSSKFSGIKSNDKHSIDTWDLIDNKQKTIPLIEWHIVMPHIITLDSKNIKILHKLLQKILNKQ